jgi:hypothetical protein
MTGVMALRQGDFTAALLDPALACPPGLRAWNGSDPAARLAIHRNNVIATLLDALGDTFPVVQQLVGDEFFRAMAAVFVRRAPPRSRILAHYGHEFPVFIEQFSPADGLLYLADMARLELARVQAYHAADAAALASETLSAALVSGERIGDLRIGLHPSASVFSSSFAVVSLWAAHQDGSDFGAISLDRPEEAIVLRDGLDVLVLHAPPGGGEFVKALQHGNSLADAVSVASIEEPAFDVSAMLVLLARHSALTSIHSPGKPLS